MSHLEESFTQKFYLSLFSLSEVVGKNQLTTSIESHLSAVIQYYLSSFTCRNRKSHILVIIHLFVENTDNIVFGHKNTCTFST